MVVVESAVTSIYICYAEDPLLIHRWDAEFFNQMSEMLHQRLQHRSARAREVLTHDRLDSMRETIPVWKKKKKMFSENCDNIIRYSLIYSFIWKSFIFRFAFCFGFLDDAQRNRTNFILNLLLAMGKIWYLLEVLAFQGKRITGFTVCEFCCIIC